MTWTPIDSSIGFFVAEYRVPGFRCNSTALRLEDGRFLVFSPGGKLAETFSEELGQVRALLAPNSMHHMGVVPFQERFKEAGLFAASSAKKRLSKKGHSEIQELSELTKILPPHIEILRPPKTKIGETWLRVETSEGVAWCVGDSFFNMPKLARKLGPRTVQKILRSAPGLRISNLMKWGALADRPRFKEWVLAQLEADKPKTIIFLHGKTLQCEEGQASLSSQVASLVKARL